MKREKMTPSASFNIRIIVNQIELSGYQGIVSPGSSPVWGWSQGDLFRKNPNVRRRGSKIVRNASGRRGTSGCINLI